MRRIAATLLTLMFLAVTVLIVTHLSVRRETGKVAPPSSDKVARPTLAIKASIEGSPWKSDTATYPLKGQKVTLKVDQIPGATTRWYQIAPDLSKIYKNANHPWESDPYKWIGFAKIDYTRTELTKFRGQWEIQPFSPEASDRTSNKLTKLFSMLTRSKPDSSHYHDDVGSFWFQVEVEKDGRVERSPGIEDCDKKGMSPQVFRVSIRDGEGYLGYLTTFFNVPGLFGCIPHQSNNYIGVDCCDVLVAAYGVWADRKFKKDYAVSMLVTRLPLVAECDILNGKPDRRLEWGKEIHPGQFIAVRFSGAKQYQHIGALHSDADKDAVLSEQDLVIHAGPLPLRYSTLSEGCFDGHAVVLDPKLSRLASEDHQLVQFARDILYMFK